MTKYSPKDQKSATKSNTKKKHKADEGWCICLIKFICFIVIPFGLTYGYLVRFVYKTNYYFNDGVGDISIRHFASDLNPVMCQAYKVSSWNPADVYLVSGRAKVDHHKRNILKRRDSQLFPGSFERDNAFYLLEGSHIRVNACRRRERFDPHVETVDILLFKGDDSWDDWKSGKCEDCPLERITLSNSNCEEGGQTILKHHVDDRDIYYIAVTTKNGYSIEYLNVRAELEILRTTFDIRHAQQMCHMTKECVLNLTYSSDVDVVMAFGDDITFNSFTSECQFRFMFMIGIFVILPGCLVVFAFCCCGCLMYCEKKDKKNVLNKQDNESQRVSTNDKDKLVDNELPPDYSTIAHTGSIQAV